MNSAPSAAADLDFGVADIVDRADDVLIRVVRDAIAAIGLLTAAGACGVGDNVLSDTLKGTNGRRVPFQFALAIAMVAPEAHRAAIADAMVKPLQYAIAPILPLTTEQRLARLELRVVAKLGAAGLDVVEENRR